jgi:hypothetical protein
MLLRAQYRGLVARQLIAANTLASSRVYESRALPVGSEKLPAILLQTPRERKESVGRGAPKFNTTFDLYVVARVEGMTYQVAEINIEIFTEQIELAILANSATVNPLQQFSLVETETVIDGTGKTFLAEASILFRCELYQTYDPAMPDVLADIRVDVHSAPGGPTTATVDIPFPAPEVP